jgi:acetyl esterase
MPVHPQVQGLLDAMAARPAPPLWSLPAAEARRAADEGAAMLRSLVAVEECAAVRDRTIARPARLGGGEIGVRVYQPRDGYGPFGVLVYLHGGGFVIGSLDSVDGVCRMLANRARCVVVSVDYRLAPEHPFPAGLDDAIAATEWVQDNAAEINGDRFRVAVAGDSAGANLAAVVALANRGGVRPPLKLQALLYPSTDRRAGYVSLAENGSGYLLESDMRAWFLRCYTHGTDVAVDDWRLSPLCASSHDGVAPALVITAEYDPLRDEGEAYAAALRASGVAVESTRYDGMIHGFVSFLGIVDAAQVAVDQTALALRRALA